MTDLYAVLQFGRTETDGIYQIQEAISPSMKNITWVLQRKAFALQYPEGPTLIIMSRLALYHLLPGVSSKCCSAQSIIISSGVQESLTRMVP